MVNTSFTFYKNNVPFEFPQWFKETWTSSSKVTLTAAPFTGHILFVRELCYMISQDFEISVGTMRMKHSDADGSNQYFQYDFATANELISASASVHPFIHPSGTNEIHGRFTFDPPIKLRQSTGKSFTVADQGSVTIVGSIEMTLRGWSMTETDYDEVA
jgi:hypothetical protein